jgi:hypothetical protein
MPGRETSPMNGPIEVTDTDDISSQAVSQNHPADGDGILGVQQVRTTQYRDYEEEQWDSRAHQQGEE